MKKEKLLFGIMSGVLAVCLLTGCGTKSSTADYGNTAEMSYSGNMASDMNAAVPEEAKAEAGFENEVLDKTVQETADSVNQEALADRKLIKTVEMNVETQEFDVLLSSVEEKTAALGGYIESLTTYNGSTYSQETAKRNASLTLRIPKDSLAQFLSDLAQEANVVNRSEYVEDVTLTYVDMESRKKALVTEQDRLLELLGKAEVIEDIIAIEQRLSEVRYQIENMESTLRTYDNKVDYSTVYLYISEVTRLSPVTEDSAYARMAKGFGASVESITTGLKELGIWFIIKLPYFVIVIVILICTILVLRRRTRRIKKQQSGKEAGQSGQGNTPPIQQ